MKTSTFLALAASGAQLAAAHTTVWNVVINGEKQPNGKGKYIDNPPNDSPVIDLKSKDMTCNVIESKASKPIEVKGGDKIGIEWHYEKDEPNDMIIDPSHKGPVITYMAPAESGASGSGWVKIAEKGWANGEWGVETLIKNKGVHDITVPDVPAGNYLLRPEIIALHEGNQMNGAQFYMECIHIKVTSSGSTALPEGVSIPGVYKADDPGVHYNIYTGDDHSKYQVPGGEVWSGAGGSGSGSGSGDDSPPKGTSNNTPTTLATVTKPSATGTSEANSDDDNDDNDEEPEEPKGSGSGSGSGGDVAEDWEQCGGEGWEGPTKCNKGFKCVEENQWYFQCVQ